MHYFLGENALFSWATKFRMPRVANIQDPNLSRLAFFVRYEQMVEYEQVRNDRAEPRQVQVEQGLALLLEAENTFQFRVIPPSDMQVESGQFKMLLLVRDSEQGRKEQLAYNANTLQQKGEYLCAPISLVSKSGVFH
ncbi:hypothetical protein H6F89_33555 [Cyanobacteria bacterium FACHB-63]|nr:hypothetical protein [Cyanobacteria bacterium FACHB-63]